jgi:hypothetical protein
MCADILQLTDETMVLSRTSSHASTARLAIKMTNRSQAGASARSFRMGDDESNCHQI